MPDSHYRMIQQQSWPCPSHDFSHPFPHLRFAQQCMVQVGKVPSFLQNGQRDNRACAYSTLPALRAQSFVPLFLPAVEADHLFHGLFFLFDAGHYLCLPAFQFRKLLLHHRNSFFFSNFLLRVFIEFFYKLGLSSIISSMVQSCCRFTLLIAVSTIICAEATKMHICSAYFIGCERHSATSAKFHFP